MEWKHLEPRPESASRQLFVKGRRILASSLHSRMIANALTPEELANDMDLSLEVILEAISYSEANEDLIKAEGDRSRQRIKKAS